MQIWQTSIGLVADGEYKIRTGRAKRGRDHQHNGNRVSREDVRSGEALIHNDPRIAMLGLTERAHDEENLNLTRM